MHSSISVGSQEEQKHTPRHETNVKPKNTSQLREAIEDQDNLSNPLTDEQLDQLNVFLNSDTREEDKQPEMSAQQAKDNSPAESKRDMHVWNPRMPQARVSRMTETGERRDSMGPSEMASE